MNFPTKSSAHLIRSRVCAAPDGNDKLRALERTSGHLRRSISTSDTMASLRTKLKNGQIIPSVGFGCYQVTGSEAVKIFKQAAEAGYRHFDSASFYKNEAEVGQALNAYMKSSGTKRSEFYYTTKAWTSEQGPQLAKNIDKAIERCALGYIDLFLLHWPAQDKETRTSSWKALAQAVNDGRIKSAGVSNYNRSQIEEIYDLDTGVDPVINQIDLCPWVQDKGTIEYCQSQDIVLEAYSPLARAKNMKDPKLVKIAESYDRTPAQILVKWSLQRGFVPLPKSSDSGRMKNNLDVGGFEISKEDMDKLNAYSSK